MKIILPYYFYDKKISTCFHQSGVHFDRNLIFINYLFKKDLYLVSKFESESDIITTNYHYVHQSTLVKIFGNHKYKNAIKSLEQNHFFEIDHYYTTGRGSKSRPKQYKLNQNLIQKDRWYFYYELTDKRSKNALNNLNQLISKSRTNNLHLQHNGIALFLIDNLKQLHIPNISSEKLTTYCTIDSFGHRFHSPLTNMSKSLRKDLKLLTGKKTELIEIDIVNSQPFFLSQLNSNILVKLLSEKDVLLVDPILQELLQSSDFNRFKQMIGSSKQDFYTDIGNMLNIRDRDESKKVFIPTLFTKWIDQSNIMSKLFPGIAKFMIKLKKLNLESNSSIKKHSNLAFLLQRFESWVCLGLITNQLKTLNISFVATIHDSWIIQKNELLVFTRAFNSIEKMSFQSPKLRYRSL